MSAQTPSLPSEPEVKINFGAGSALIRDYTFVYSVLEISVHRSFNTVFPRSGHLIFSFITGNDFESHFLNYDRSVTRPNHMYISGLFSKSSLLVQQFGTGGGYAMKVHPVIGYHFLKTPMHELTDRQIRLCHIVDKHGRTLENLEDDYKIDSFDHPRVKQFFIDALPPKEAYINDPIYHAVNLIADRRGQISVEKLAAQFHMSKRTLRRQFLLKVGLSPQAYAKIWQVQYAMELIMRNPKSSLPEIAFKAGYYDTAHLARDFRNRVSLSPSELHQDINPLSQDYFNALSSLK